MNIFTDSSITFFYEIDFFFSFIWKLTMEKNTMAIIYFSAAFLALQVKLFKKANNVWALLWK